MEYRLGLIGFGGVNHALTEIIRDYGDKLYRQYDIRLKITFVSDLFLGAVSDEDGLSLDSLINLPRHKGAFAELQNGTKEPNTEQLIQAGITDILSEATFTNAETGEPATTYCRQALEQGVHVVTTNKGPVALALDSLTDIAQQNNCEFRFEGAVMSGTPVLNLAAETFAGNPIKGFCGILNGTCNYIIGQMEKGVSKAEAISQAQALGYAEADPTADVEGFDVMLKVGILGKQLLNLNIPLAHIERSGIENLSESDVLSAVDEGQHWKLIGEAVATKNGDYRLTVGPKKLSGDHPLAGVSGPVNALCFDTELLGSVTIVGPGAGRRETGFALLSDILAIHRKQQG
ncbi:MAG: homoserine dehydrogenase [Porticoccaceae bacterium]|nr:homoserine dehydrogenase [Porticoccaceae bacterium]